MRVSCIWHSEQHCAFTDIVYCHGLWWCAFREASAHMSWDGVIRIVTSVDARQWHPQALLRWQGGDLRDPKFSKSTDGNLLLTAGMRWATPLTNDHYVSSLGCYYDSVAQQWCEPQIDASGEGTWRWAPTWFDGFAYAVGYAGKDHAGCLYQSADGLSWVQHVAPFFPSSRLLTNESSLAFDSQSQRAYALTRRDAVGGSKGLLGVSEPPYRNWQWQGVNRAIGGQKLLPLSNGEWVAGFRYINYRHRRARTLLQKVDMQNARLKPWLSLPSSGDCSYVGMVEYHGRLLVSYYSSHEASQSRIYVADIPLVVKKRSRRFQ